MKGITHPPTAFCSQTSSPRPAPERVRISQYGSPLHTTISVNRFCHTVASTANLAMTRCGGAIFSRGPARGVATVVGQNEHRRMGTNHDCVARDQYRLPEDGHGQADCRGRLITRTEHRYEGHHPSAWSADEHDIDLVNTWYTVLPPPG